MEGDGETHDRGLSCVPVRVWAGSRLRDEEEMISVSSAQFSSVDVTGSREEKRNEKIMMGGHHGQQERIRQGKYELYLGASRKGDAMVITARTGEHSIKRMLNMALSIGKTISSRRDEAVEAHEGRVKKSFGTDIFNYLKA